MSKKRNFENLFKGIPVLISNIEKENPKEANKRKLHYEEKIEKLKNPNNKVSSDKIVIKSISRDIDGPFL